MTKIKLLKAGDEPALESFLAPHLDSSLFLLNNSRTVGFVDNGKFLEGTYAAAFDGQNIVGVVALYWNKVLIIQTPALHYLAPLIKSVSAAVDRPIGRLIGPGEQVSAAMSILNIQSANVQLDEQEGLYSLDLANLLVPPELQAGRVRAKRIEVADIDLISAWRVDFALQALGAVDTPQLRENTRRGIVQAQQDGRCWLLEADGKAVATTAFNAAIKEAVQVGGVWTPPEYRSRGYARAIVAASLLDARAEGVQRGILFTGDENYAAIKAYQALGFQRNRDYRMVILRD